MIFWKFDLTNNKLSHVAFILDGNKRWAEKNKFNNINGYKKGFDNIINIVEYSSKIGLENITLFTLSSENFNRPSINLIYEIIYNNFSKLINELIEKKNIKIVIFGSRKNLPKKILDIFNQAENLTKNNEGLNLNLAFNYGFKEEIKEVLKNYKKKINNINLEDQNQINNLFYLASKSDPDLLIRTGGYKRLSNFIMYNLTYTELFFTETLWPDFDIKELEDIISKFINTNRKYGL